MAKQILTSLDLLSLPSLTTPKTGSVGFGAKSDGLYQRIGTVETKLSIDGHTHTIAQITGLQSALDGKQPTIPTGATSQYFRGDKTWRTLNTSVVPEGNNLYFTNARVKAYGDTLYSPLGHSHKTVGVTDVRGINEGGDNYLNLLPSEMPDRAVAPYFAYVKGLSGWHSILNVKGWTGSYASWQLIGCASTSSHANLYLRVGHGDTWGSPLRIHHSGNLTSLSQLTDNIGVGSHIANKANPHNVTKAQVGLGNVDNTADSAKNVLSATKLTTARKINGTSFNGTANITTANWGTARTLTVGNTGKSVNGSGNVSWSLSEIGALPITGGTMTGILKAQNNTSYTTKQVRNIILSTADADAASMANGDIWIKYV